MAQLGWGLSPVRKRDLWQRWRAGQSFDQIGRALAKHHSSRFVVRATGGFLPRTGRRRASALTLFEREEISRALAKGDALRAIATALGRAPSTISREVAAAGGRTVYRAAAADEAAWARARRPQWCLLARNARLRLDEHTTLVPETLASLYRHCGHALLDSTMSPFLDDESTRRAVWYLEETKSIYAEIENASGLADAVHDLGHAYSRRGDQERLRQLIKVVLVWLEGRNPSGTVEVVARLQTFFGESTRKSHIREALGTPRRVVRTRADRGVLDLLVTDDRFDVRLIHGVSRAGWRHRCARRAARRPRAR